MAHVSCILRDRDVSDCSLLLQDNEKLDRPGLEPGKSALGAAPQRARSARCSIVQMRTLRPREFKKMVSMESPGPLVFFPAATSPGGEGLPA